MACAASVLRDYADDLRSRVKAGKIEPEDMEMAEAEIVSCERMIEMLWWMLEDEVPT